MLLDAKRTALNVVWEATSFELEKLQCDAECVAQEQAGVAVRQVPQWKLSYAPVRRKFAKRSSFSPLPTGHSGMRFCC